MDINSIIESGGIITPNPHYNKSTKKTQPKFITVSDLDGMSNGNADAMAGISFDAMKDGLQGQLGEVKDYKKYIDYGIVPTGNESTESLDKQLAEAQGAMTKIGNSLAQTVVSELALGTLKAITDVFGIMGQMIFQSNGDYSNPASAKLEEWQEQFRAYAPIYADPDKTIANGGLADIGWWASNAPSIISSLTLLVPGAGVTKGLSLISKGLKISSFTRKAVQAGSKALARATKSPSVYRALNRTTTVNAANRFLENGITAVTMRGIENYQEARQVYNDSYAQIANTINEMSDEKYNKLITENSKLLEERKVDTTNRNEVSKALAKASADATFKIDWFNVGWDVLQLYSLKNMWKNIKNAPGSSAAIRKAHRNSMRYAGLSKEEIAEIEKLRSRGDRFREWFGDKLYGTRLAIASEASEGAEEALNYIAQEEGMTYANVLLGKEKGDKDYGAWKNLFTGFDGRLRSYVSAPQLWDSAFWGVLGGVVFQGAGSQFAKLRNKVIRDKDIQKDEREDSKWYQLDELPENKRRIKDIENRQITVNDYIAKLKRIKDGEDIYKSTKNNKVKFTDDVEQKAAVDRLTNEFIQKLTINAAHNGNLDLLKEWMANDDVRKAMVKAGIFDAENESDRDAASKKFVEDCLQRMNNIEEMYDNELMALADAATMLDRKASWGSNVPMEYLQIIASDNIARRMAVGSIRNDITTIEERIAQLEEQFKDKLDSNINHRANVRFAVLTNILADLRIQRRNILKDKTKSLSNQIALDNIDKRIKAVEDKLSDAELILANVYSIAAHYDENGKMLFQGDKTLDSEAAIYQQAMTTLGNGTPGAISKFTSLAHIGLSERSRKLVDDAIIGQYEKLLHDSDVTYKDLDDISPTLNGLYRNVEAQEVQIGYLNNATVRTREELSKELSHLHNSMSEARRKAINRAGGIIKSLYMKHGDVVKDYIRNRYNLSNTTGFNQAGMTNSEIRELQDALDILNLSKSYNKDLFSSLDNSFALWDDEKAAMEKEESESSPTPQNQPTPSPNPDPNNPPQQPSPQPTPTPTQPQSQQAGQTGFQRQNGKVRIKPNIDGGFDIETGIPDNEVGYNYYINEAGEIKLEWPVNGIVPGDIRSNTALYEGYDRAIDKPENVDMSLTTHPILAPDANGRYQVKELGWLVYKSQSNPSTGEGATPTPAQQPSPSLAPTPAPTPTQPASQPEPAPAAKPAQTAEEREEVLYGRNSATDSFSSAVKSVMTAYKADKSIDIDSLAVGIVEEQVASGVDRTVAQEQVSRAIRIVKQTIEKRNDAHGKMQSRIAETIAAQSSIVENKFTSPNAANYKASVKALIDQYAVTFGIPERNGKLYVNLEDLLRFCNKIEADEAIASIMYNTLKEYLKTDEARQRFITTDENIDNNKFLENVAKSEETRSAERLESYVSTVRVDITSIPNEAKTQEERDLFYQAIDELGKDEELTIDKIGGRIVLRDKKGRAVGSLAIPRVNVDTGGLETTVEGWIYDVTKHNDDRIDSKLRDMFVRWLEEETDSTKELNNILYEYAYENPSDERKAELLEAFAKNVEIVKAKENGFVDKNATDALLINHLAKLWRYTTHSVGLNRESHNIDIEGSVNEFFQKGYDSFVNSLMLSKKPGAFTVTTAQITEGERIKATNDSRNEKEYIPADKAIAGGVNPEIHKIGIGSPSSRNTIITSGLGNQVYKNAAAYAISVTIPTRSGYNEYVGAAIANVNDGYISDEAKEIVNEVQKELYRRIDYYVKHPSAEAFADIENFLLSVFDTKSNSNLLYGLRIIRTGKGNNRVIGVYDDNNNGITIYKNNGNYTANRIVSSSGKYELNVEGYRSKTISISDKDAMMDAIKNAFELVRFNVKPEYVEADNVSTMPLRGLASRHNGKFIIKVGDKTWTYNSFNEFILNNNLVRLNTKPNAEGTSNFNRKSTGSQRKNQTLRVAINEKTTSPVKGNQPTQQVQPAIPTTRPLNERLVTALNSTEEDKASAIFRELLGITPFFIEENLKALQNLNLLPKNIIFDKNFQNRKDANGNTYEDINAEIYPTSGQVTIGPRLIEMFESDPEQALRKLIHEQLHYHLHRHKGFIRNAKTIFDEFKAAVNNNIPELAKFNQERLRLYFFDNIANNEEALEEFLVESLTSRELADVLNTIPAKVKGKGGTNLIKQLLDLFKKIFNWSVTKGSLYEKEYYTVVENLAKSKEAKTAKKKTTKKKPTNELQTTLNFDEEQNDNKPNEQPVETPATKPIEQPTETPTEQEEAKLKRPTIRDRQQRFKGFKRSSITEESSNYTEEMQAIKGKAIADGTFMKAPNGNPTNLNERQWLQVRTKNFMNWFGDWINDKENASKVVDENGEPLIVYHGSPISDFNIFKKSEIDSGYYFTSDKEYADSYGNTRGFFLNIKNMKDISVTYKKHSKTLWNGKSFEISEPYYNGRFISLYEEAELELNHKNVNRDAEYLKSKGFDGIKGNDSFNEELNSASNGTEYVVFNPNQIKSATSNDGSFSTTNDDIRHSSRTELFRNAPSVMAMSERLPLAIQPQFDALVAQGAIETSCR